MEHHPLFGPGSWHAEAGAIDAGGDCFGELGEIFGKGHLDVGVVWAHKRLTIPRLVAQLHGPIAGDG